MYYASETKVKALTRIRRERILPKPGELLVSPGVRVEATQVVARAYVPGDFRIVPVARRLDVPTSKIDQYLQVDLGDTVHEGTVIAKRGRLLGHSVESPMDGVVTAKGEGRILIEAQPTPFELHAYISGRVLETDANRRVVVEASGALLQGAWGVGGESIGVLKVMTDDPHGPLESQSVDPSCHGAILIAGTLLDQAVLERAEDMEARGIVTGSLAPELIPSLEALSFPVMVTDAVDGAQMAGPIFDLLRANEGEEASIGIPAQGPWRGRRPELVIPKPDKTPPTDNGERDGQLTVGTRVRMVRAPHAGLVGTVAGFPAHARRIETGARVRCADVDIGQEELISVPLVNLDILM